MNELAEYFAELVTKDELLELFVRRHLGLVCFRIKVILPNDTSDRLTLLVLILTPNIITYQ